MSESQGGEGHIGHIGHTLQKKLRKSALRYLHTTCAFSSFANISLPVVSSSSSLTSASRPFCAGLFKIDQLRARIGECLLISRRMGFPRRIREFGDLRVILVDCLFDVADSVLEHGQ